MLNGPRRVLFHNDISMRFNDWRYAIIGWFMVRYVRAVST